MGTNPAAPFCGRSCGAGGGQGPVAGLGRGRAPPAGGPAGDGLGAAPAAAALSVVPPRPVPARHRTG